MTSTAPSGSALFLSRRDIRTLMELNDYLGAVAHAFRAAKEGYALSPPPMHVPAKDGGFHAKGALLHGERSYVALKLNGNFPDNPAKNRLPTIQGAILLCNADNGAVLAIMDSIEITLRRTAAASALAARHLARTGASTLAILGCGGQARAQCEALAAVLTLKRARVWDLDRARAEQFARQTADVLGFPFAPASSARDASLDADVIVTCTTSRAPILLHKDVSPGAFIAAVGADSPAKSEIEPQLMARGAVIVDHLEQCAHMGDLRHAIAAGAMSADDVRCELGDVVTGAGVGRNNESEIVIFDSTGVALQDVASAAIVYERACARGSGLALSFS